MIRLPSSPIATLAVEWLGKARRRGLLACEAGAAGAAAAVAVAATTGPGDTSHGASGGDGSGADDYAAGGGDEDAWHLLPMSMRLHLKALQACCCPHGWTLALSVYYSMLQHCGSLMTHATGRTLDLFLRVLETTPWKWREAVLRALKFAGAPYAFCFAAVSHPPFGDAITFPNTLNTVDARRRALTQTRW